MQIPKKYSKIKTRLHKELSRLQKQQRALAIRKITELPFFNEFPEITVLRKRLNSGVKKKSPAEASDLTSVHVAYTNREI